MGRNGDVDEGIRHQSEDCLRISYNFSHKDTINQRPQPAKSHTMKLTTSTIVLSVLAATALATPADFSKVEVSPRDLAAQVEGCGAAGSCAGPGGGDLCNDRVSSVPLG